MIVYKRTATDCFPESEEMKLGAVNSSIDYTPYIRQKDTVDAAQFNVDLKAEIGQRLGWDLRDVLRLNTLRRQAKHYVTHSFHFS